MGIENVDALKPNGDENVENTEANQDVPVGQVEVVNEEPEQSAAHPVDENPEEHVGDETPDPWDDPKQTDWQGPDETPKEES